MQRVALVISARVFLAVRHEDPRTKDKQTKMAAVRPVDNHGPRADNLRLAPPVVKNCHLLLKGSS